MLYTHDGRGMDVLVPGKAGKVDLDVARAWKYFGVGKEMPCVGERERGKS